MEKGLTVIAPGASAVAQTAGAGLFGRFIEYLDIANPATLRTYKTALRQFAGAFPLADPRAITALEIKAWRDSLIETHKPATVQLYMVAIRRFYSWIEAMGGPNPAKGLKGAKLDKTFKKDYLTANQAHEVLADIDTTTIKGLRDKAITALMLTAGLRTIEVQRADVQDLRPLADKTVLYIQGKGKTEKADFVEVTPAVERLIRDYLTAREAKDGPLFASTANRNRGGRVTTRTISAICKRAMAGAGLVSDRLTAHSFRHTAATLSLLGGRTLAEVQQLLRHTNINTTLIYQHALDKAQNQCAATVAGMIM